MSLLDFQTNPVGTNAAMFVVAAAVIWFAGVRLERLADAIALRTGMSQAFAGMLLLALATSLPEVATIGTAALIGNASLAVHNLVGGIVMQTAVLAVADGFTRKEGALTSFRPRFVLLLEGVGLVLVLQVALSGMAATTSLSVFSVGIWSVAILVTYLLVLYAVWRYQDKPRWKPVDFERDEGEEGDNGEEREESGRSLSALYGLFGGAALAVLFGGWVVARTGDALAAQTGLGSGFVGATLVAISTSLPELSTTVSASRRGHYSMAISNIFGTNAVDVALIFLADILFRGGTLLQTAGRTAMFSLTMGTVVTCVYLWGLLERRNRTVFGIGWDSAIVAVLYVLYLAILYAMS